MAKVVTDDTHYKDVADAIRGCFAKDIHNMGYYEKSTEQYTPAEMPKAINDVRQCGYDNGHYDGFFEGEQHFYETGYAEGEVVGREQGKQEEYDRFWDKFQANGRTASYIYAFAGVRWDDQTYNPKYPIVANAAGGMFYYSEITDTKVNIDITLAGGSSTSALFQNAKKLKTIRLLKVVPETSFSSGFTNCNSLEHITIEGVIGSNLDIHWSPLTADSIRNIVGALSTTATGRTVTFKKTAKEAAFTDEEWAELIGQRPNWTVVLA